MRRASVAWLAVFALFVQAMAPLSAAWASGTGAGGELQVICTANGVKTIAIDQDGLPIDPTEAVTCAFCVLHASGAILTPKISERFTHSVVEQDSYALVLSDVHANLWRASPRPPRGPPLSA
ncbi:DUF2946 domain-containing protein [Pseudomonadota bacterium]